ncbi:CFEM domain-containing protein [Fusarium keratoplasticum]|uniref:CFEM domain-containing protein n=1 Tax=Fusarium keratoplasticum TaxID=1328300 RepID=A0ACC0QR61_9HYPO|nr:CFEM domain-containing protein [Fusarium keratoplasticum]KAI8663656.1 CFEM domain-containing protein [Fusarium keratoplasticum]
MRTLSLVLFSLTGILALENGSDNGGVGAVQMPDCAVNCIKEHVPNSGCDLPHITCLCDPDFRTKHGPAIAPCLIVLCDANEINKVQNAWRDQCDGVPSTQKDQESVKSLRRYRADFKNGSIQHLGSSPGRKGFNTNDHDIDAKAGAKINPTEVNTETNPNTNNLEFNLERNFNFNFKLDPKTNAYANAEILDEFYQLIRKRNGIDKLDNE